MKETLPNTIAGASQIREHILKFTQSIQYDRIIVGMEATSVYSFHPSTFLAEDQDIKALNVEVVVMNPKAIQRFKGLFDEDKTDQIDLLFQLISLFSPYSVNIFIHKTASFYFYRFFSMLSP